MAVIEHRDSEGVLGAFESTGATKFAIWQGTLPVMVFDEQDPDYIEGQENRDLAMEKLTTWLNFISQGGTTAIYTLKIYPLDAKNITNKTPVRAATRFQLNAANNADYQQTPDGRVMVIRDRPQGMVGSTQRAGSDPLLQQLLDQNKQTMDLLVKMQQQSQETKLDKVIGLLSQGLNPQESTLDKVVMLGKHVIENPDIIDRIGYILRPSIYSREPIAEPIAGTTQTAPPAAAAQQQPPTNQDTMSDTQQSQEQEQGTELTQDEMDALDTRMNAALDKIEDLIGIEDLTEALEKLAVMDEAKLKSLLSML